MLGATPRTPVAELFDLGDTPEASAAARALSVPRSRLPAEVAFLPGASDRAEAILDDLRAGRRPEMAGLPPLAASNLLAHLCAAGLATNEDLSDLARLMPANADEALAAAIDADRDVAGMPPCQRPALAAELNALTDAHAGSLAAACAARPDGAERLAALLESGPARPTTLLRRAAASWTRRTATAMADAETAANAAFTTWRKSPDSAHLAALDDAARRWAALSRPQRLADAKAALDHPPSVRVLGSWRAGMRQVAEAGGDAAPVARLLADLFADLPTEAVPLAEEARKLAARDEEQALAPLLQRLEYLVKGFSADVLPLRACMATRPFGPGSRKEARELWEAFDAAASASATSEAAWTTVLRLAPLLAAPPTAGRARGTASFFEGLIRRAEADNRADLAGRLRAMLRQSQADMAAERDEGRHRSWRWLPWWLAPVRDPALGPMARHAIRQAADPEQRRVLEAKHLAERRKTRRWRLGLSVAVVFAGLVAAVWNADDDYAANAPFRRHPSISLAAVPAPIQVPIPALIPVPTPPAPAPAAPAISAFTMRPKPRFFSFPVRGDEREPGSAKRDLLRTEVRWCLFNGARLSAARSASAPADEAGLGVLSAQLNAGCDGRSARRLDAEAVQADVARNQDRLTHEGEAMLETRAQ